MTGKGPPRASWDAAAFIRIDIDMYAPAASCELLDEPPADLIAPLPSAYNPT